jgi:hypothetical protein
VELIGEKYVYADIGILPVGGPRVLPASWESGPDEAYVANGIADMERSLAV